MFHNISMIDDKYVSADLFLFFFFFQAEDGIRDAQESRGLGDVYKRQVSTQSTGKQHWEKVAFLMKEHWDLHIKYVTSEKDVQVAGNDYDELHKQYCDLHKVYTSLKAKNASQAETEKLLRSIIAQCGTTSVYNGRNCGTSIVKCYEHSSYKK
eukprot:TRINITY_DN37210_c0_g1_i1.p1 TRINITY_DN37210_c0_g1~~TRINITY_DN37210_c0_g1_i1.p1  ORF type:complete len:153 (+),score=13.00 TRINITY_DN37210_c0_g1_i1:41-499(+)